MYASYVSGDLFSFTFLWRCEGSFTNVECYCEAEDGGKMKKRSHLHHNRSFFCCNNLRWNFSTVAVAAKALRRGCEGNFSSAELFSVVYILCIPGRDFTSQCIIWAKCVCVLSFCSPPSAASSYFEVETWGIADRHIYASPSFSLKNYSLQQIKQFRLRFDEALFRNWYSI
jgi:hypothetical protein